MNHVKTKNVYVLENIQIVSNSRRNKYLDSRQINVQMYECVYVCTSVCMCECECVCVCVCTCVCVLIFVTFLKALRASLQAISRCPTLPPEYLVPHISMGATILILSSLLFSQEPCSGQFPLPILILAEKKD